MLHKHLRFGTKSPDEDLSKIVNDIRSEKQDTFLPQIIKLMLVVFVAIFIPSVTLLYTRYGDGYQIFRYTKGIVHGSDGVTIPSTYKGKNVIAIGESAFQNAKVSKVNI